LVFAGRRVADVTDISLILFDLNGVLYRYERDARIAYLAAVAKQSPEAVRAAIWDSGFEDQGDAGALDADDYLLGFGARLGCALAEADWVAAQSVAVSPIGASLALLAQLHTGVQCAVLTNNNMLIRRHFGAFYPEIAALVGDRTFVSAEFAARKPEPEVYRRCLIRLGVEPAAALFIDDSAANVAGARGAGLHAWDYTGPEALAAELRVLGLLD
jgi:putative hydrolase of the HAD superfamily